MEPTGITNKETTTTREPKKEDNLFHNNLKLEIYSNTNIEPLYTKKDEGNQNKISSSQDKLKQSENSDDEIFFKLREKSEDDSVYNYKKDFLVLKYNQTEDTNSLEYKRKVISKKLMTDITFSLNKAFEFTFQDKIKNDIIYTLTKKTKGFYDSEIKTQTDYNGIDNELLLDTCNEEYENFYYPDGEIKTENSSIQDIHYLGRERSTEYIANIEDELNHTNNNYEKIHYKPIVFNEVTDVEFDYDLYKFFEDYIKEHSGQPIASKVKLVLSFINEINPETKVPIYTNEERNNILKYWKKEYEISLEKEKERMKEEKRNRKKDLKAKKKFSGERRSFFENNLIKKKPNDLFL